MSSIACSRASNRSSATLPPDIRIQPIRDQSRFIRRSFEDIKLHLILGSLLASLVVFLFMRNPKITFIAALAIPTSIIGTFAVMKAFGFTLNNMTMLSLSLATGIVIDDAIVVLENIFRYVEEKHVTPHEAAIKATEEIGLAVMATTLSLCVIFPARRVHDRPGRALLLQLRDHVSGGHHDLDAGLVHADADALLDVAEEERLAGPWRDVQIPRLLRLARRALRPDAALGADAPPANGRHRRRGGRISRAALSAYRQGARS
jgi:hypothetical protein